MVAEWGVMQHEEGRRGWGFMKECLRGGGKEKGRGIEKGGRVKLSICIFKNRVRIAIPKLLRKLKNQAFLITCAFKAQKNHWIVAKLTCLA